MFQSFKLRWWNKANIIDLQKLSVASLWRLPGKKGATVSLSAPHFSNTRERHNGKKVALFIKMYQYMRLNTGYSSAANIEANKERAKSQSTNQREEHIIQPERCVQVGGIET